MNETLTLHEKSTLLRLARAGLEGAARRAPLPRLEAEALPDRLRRTGASFVTLTRAGALRGCIGTLTPSLPLAQDVLLHAAAAAQEDYRFAPVAPEEAPEIEIEVSVLSEPAPLEHAGPDDLLQRLRPGIDGVILTCGARRATFLPQVWRKVSDPRAFLSLLSEKAGLPTDGWRRDDVHIQIYQVESFHEGQAPPD